MKSLWMGALVALMLATAAACSTKHIPHTTVEDTEENRSILRVVERYRDALQTRDVDAILSLTSSKYYDNSGTPDPSDDVNYEGLKEFLQKHFDKLETLQVDFMVHKIAPDEDNENKVYVEYRYVSRYQLKLPSGEQQWHVDPDVLDRLTLIKEGGDWKILSGL